MIATTARQPGLSAATQRDTGILTNYKHKNKMHTCSQHEQDAERNQRDLCVGEELLSKGFTINLIPLLLWLMP